MSKKEFTVKAAGVDRLFHKHILGKFPDQVPELKSGGKDGWQMQRTENDDGTKEWTLEQSKGAEKYRGKKDSGLSGSGASNYFILIKQRGSDDFLAIPASELCTFKKVYKRAELSLEEAEAQMKYQRLRAEKANPKLAQVIGATDADHPSSAPGGGGNNAANTVKDEEEADSDEEWKDIRAKAASNIVPTLPGRRPASALGATVAKRAIPAAGDDYEDGRAGIDGYTGGDEFVPRPRGAEDWEHEDEAADDDLDMGQEDSDPEGADGVPGARRSPSVSDGDDDDIAPEQAQRALKRLLRQTGLADEDDDGRETSPVMSDSGSDSGSDVEDLDAMALEVLPDVVPRVVATVEGGSGDGGASRKRKSPPPSSGGGDNAIQAAAARQPSPQPSPAAAGGANKKAKTSEAPSAPTDGAVAESEVIQLLRSRGGLPLGDIVAHFKLRVMRSDSARNEFVKMVKRLAKLEGEARADGKRYLVLR